MKEEIQLLLDEAKKGILTVSDFYSDEIVSYFLYSAIYGVFIGILLIMSALVLHLYWGKKDSYSISKSPLPIVPAFLGFAGLIVALINLHPVLLISIAPKIYITKELINFF